MSAPVTAFSIAAAFRLRDYILSKPPASEFTNRPELRGELVFEAALPLELCPTTNGTRHAKGWQLAKIKGQIYQLFIYQHGGTCKAPLPGRPQVIVRRFSSVQPDTFSDFGKMAVDKLCVGPKRLGFLRDDRPKDCEVHQVWEAAPPGGGCVVVEVRG